MKRIIKNDDGKPLSKDITGKYKYNPNRNEYLFYNKTFNSKEKKIYNIRIADFKHCCWVNHKDYTAIQCDVIEENDYYKFRFNGINYQIPVKPQYDDTIGYFVNINKN